MSKGGVQLKVNVPGKHVEVRGYAYTRNAGTRDGCDAPHCSRMFTSKIRERSYTIKAQVPARALYYLAAVLSLQCKVRVDY